MVDLAVATGCEANQSVFNAAPLRAEGSVMLVKYSLYTCFDKISTNGTNLGVKTQANILNPQPALLSSSALFV